MFNKWLFIALLFSPIALFSEEAILCSKNEGPRGPRGRRGERGPFGHDGQRGPHGHNGPRGFRGYRGHRGHRGAMGLSGSAGADGATGATGATGPSALGQTIPGVDLLFTFTTVMDSSPTASGRWQFFVIRPDFSQVPGPIVNVRDPSTTYTVTVPGPFFFGIYTGVLYNIDMQNLTITAVLSGNMQVTTNAGFQHIKIFTEGSDITDSPGSVLEDMIQGFAIVPPF